MPPSDLLEQVAGVETTLRAGRRLGAIGWVALVLSVIQGGLAAANWIGTIRLPSTLLAWLVGSAVVCGVLAIVFTQWLRFWVRESRRPFRYVYAMEAFQQLGDLGTLDLSWLDRDISQFLSERIARLSRFEKPDMKASNGGALAPVDVDSLVYINGTVGVRKPEVGGLQIVVTPWVRVGGPSAPAALAHPVTYLVRASSPARRSRNAAVMWGWRTEEAADPSPSADETPEKLDPSDYKKLVERVYFSVATEIYKEIRDSVRKRIALLPWRSFRAAAYFNEAEDYVRSNTLDAYEDASELYLDVIRIYEPGWFPAQTPRGRPLRQRLRAFVVARRLDLISWAARFWDRLGQTELMLARSYIGYANTMVYRRILASLSGQRVIPVFEARPAVELAIRHLDNLPDSVPGHREAYFEAHVTKALVLAELQSPTSAEAALDLARSREPLRKEVDPHYLFVRGYLEPDPHSRIQFLRRAVEADNKFEVAQFELAKASEQLWRARPKLEADAVKDGALSEFNRVVDLNPGNIAAWASIAEIYWLLDDNERARSYYERGREYKEMKRGTFVANLDLGLSRLDAEAGKFADAYQHYIDATSAMVAVGPAHERYTEDGAGTSSAARPSGHSKLSSTPTPRRSPRRTPTPRRSPRRTPTPRRSPGSRS